MREKNELKKKAKVFPFQLLQYMNLTSPHSVDIDQSCGLRTLSVTTKDDVILSVETSIVSGVDVQDSSNPENSNDGLPIVFIHGLGSTKAMLRSGSFRCDNID